MLKHKRVFARQCDWCKKEIILNGPDKDPFVITADWKYFCIIQRPGQPATRDCMADYLNNIKQKLHEQTFKKELEKKEKEQKEKEEKETRLASAPRMIKLADNFLTELKQREFNKRSKHPT